MNLSMLYSGQYETSAKEDVLIVYVINKGRLTILKVHKCCKLVNKAISEQTVAIIFYQTLVGRHTLKLY